MMAYATSQDLAQDSPTKAADIAALDFPLEEASRFDAEL
jgi:hypothetical protein